MMKNEKIKLCIDARMIKHSGIGVYLINYIIGLSSVDNITVILLGQRKQIIECIPNCETIVIIDFEYPIYSIKEQLGFPLAVPKCDIFWSPHYNVPIFPINAKHRIVTIHDVYHLAYSKTLRFVEKIYAKIVMKIATKLSTKIFTVSDFSLKEIVKYTHVNIEKISVIYSGISPEMIASDFRSFNIIKSKYKISDKYILFVGNLKPNKNMACLIKAFFSVKEEFLDYSLVIVGKKEGFINADNELIEKIKHDETFIDRIIFTDFVETVDIPHLYKNAALFAFPSIYEGFGFPPLEAMANQCPVLASNTTSIPEVCGSAAYYINPYDIESIANGIRKILTDSALRADLIAAGNIQYKKYQWFSAVKQFTNIIGKLKIN